MKELPIHRAEIIYFAGSPFARRRKKPKRIFLKMRSAVTVNTIRIVRRY
jgi:hypothetical protein